MDFFGSQELARRKTKWLVFYFILAVVFIVAAIYLVCAVIFLDRREFAEDPSRLWDTDLFGIVALGTLAIILIGSLYKTAQLRSGGRAVAELLGGRLIDPSSTEYDERKVINVVEEMAIASGTAVPSIYLLEHEEGINAFAAGRTTSDTAIGVTRGCIHRLNRDELQGVIGHEFSHILNGDMRLNLRLMGIVHGILCIAILGHMLLRVSSRSYRLGARAGRKGGNPLPLLGLALLVIGSIGVFFGRLIKSAVSRQREFLADAASVQFTRNPSGLAGALKKIGGLAFGSRLQSAHAEEASHLFFGNGLGEAWFGLLSTHPPLSQRIRAIDPAFDGRFPAVEETAERFAEKPPPLRAGAQPIREPRLQDLLGGGAGRVLPPVIQASQLMESVGRPTAAHLNAALTVKEALPENLCAAAHEPFGACALLYAMLLSPEATVREAQLKHIAADTSLALKDEALRLAPEIQSLPRQLKLPLIDLTLPALHHLSKAQYSAFTNTLQHLIETDQQIDLFEFTLQSIVLRHLNQHYEPHRKKVIQYYALKPLLPDCAILLSALALSGHEELGEQEKAYRSGVQQLAAGAREIPPMSLQADLGQIDQALRRLAAATIDIRKRILTACAGTVAADGVIAPSEAELIRAIADTLDCPIPPLVEAPPA